MNKSAINFIFTKEGFIAEINESGKAREQPAVLKKTGMKRCTEWGLRIIGRYNPSESPEEKDMSNPVL